MVNKTVKEREVTSELLATAEASQAQLAQLFETDVKTLPKRLRGLPAGSRRGVTVYKIRDAAARIVKPGYSIEAYLRGMNHSDLPPLLTKEYWNGQRARQIFEENAGDLWRTSQVVETYAEAAKTIRMELLLISDAVERETVLSDQQRKIIKRMIDGAISNLREQLVEKFKDYVPTSGPQLLTNSGLGPDPSGDGISEAEEDPEDPDDL